METPRPPREARPAKSSKPYAAKDKPFPKDKGKPKWAKPAADGAEHPARKAKPKDHKKSRASE
ncbi:hypothetical protein D3C72_2448010 [compost metagenome]